VSAVLLGAFGPGGMAAAVLTALIAWLLVPQLETLSAGRPWRAPVALALVALALFGIGLGTVRSSPKHPTPSSVVYAMDADAPDAWLVARGTSPPATLRVDTTASTQAPTWLASLRGAGGDPTTFAVARASIEPPSAEVVADSAYAGGRRLTVRLRAAPGTGAVAIRANGPRVLLASVDGRVIDTTRYRSPGGQWRLDYAAPPDSGFTLSLTLAEPGPLTLDLLAHTSGLPPGVNPPERAPDVVTIHSGDVTIVRRTVTIH
jgi:hypothetical protein